MPTETNQYDLQFVGIDGTPLATQRITVQDYSDTEYHDATTNIDWATLGYDNDTSPLRASGYGFYLNGDYLDFQDADGNIVSRTNIADQQQFAPDDAITWDEAGAWERYNDAHHAVYRREPFVVGGPGTRINFDWFDEKWVFPEEEPDIEDERGGALDEFLEQFKPQNTTPERSDEQE